MDTNKMREEFEAYWADVMRGDEPPPGRKPTRSPIDPERYAGDAAQFAWKWWQRSRAATGWQPMESCPKHVEVLFYREDCGVISGQLTCADTFMTDKDRESGDYSEEEQYSEDAWCYGPDGVERLDGDLVPTHWMPYPDEPEVTP